MKTPTVKKDKELLQFKNIIVKMNKRPKQTFHQSRNTNSQVHENKKCSKSFITKGNVH